VYWLVVNVADVRKIIDESIALFNNQGAEAESPGQLSMLESIRSILIRNEKKIWLRTKKGRGMVAEVNEAADRLKTSFALGDIDIIEKAIVDVEVLARAIEEESRKRSMVVT
jgi:hypothetical protein